MILTLLKTTVLFIKQPGELKKINNMYMHTVNMTSTPVYRFQILVLNFKRSWLQKICFVPSIENVENFL